MTATVIIAAVLILLLTIAYFVIHTLFLLTVSWAVTQAAPAKRKIHPAAVFLDLAPVFNLFWQVVALPRASASVRAEYVARGWPTEDEGFGRVPGLLTGWGTVVLNVFAVAGVVFLIAGNLTLAFVFSIGLLVPAAVWTAAYLIYWAQMYSYGRQLKYGLRGPEEGTVYADYDERTYAPLPVAEPAGPGPGSRVGEPPGEREGVSPPRDEEAPAPLPHDPRA